MEPKKVHGHNLADPAKRIVATLVDAIVAGVVTAIVTLPFGAVSALTTAQSFQTDNLTDFTALTGVNQGVSFISALLTLLVWLLVFIVVPIYVWRGQTLGKKLMNIKIVTESGAETEPMDIVKRYSIYLATKVLALVPFVGGLAGCVELILPFVNLVMLFTDEKRQTLLDKVGKTLVVDAK